LNQIYHNIYKGSQLQATYTLRTSLFDSD